MSTQRICLLPRLSGVGGMVSFQFKLAAGLASRNIEVCHDLGDHPYQAILVIGGTRQLAGLWQARRTGVRIVQRLDGMNWVHRLPKPGGGRRTSWRHFLRAEYGNWILSLIRSRLAHAVVYQSQFSKDWWERTHGRTTVQSSVVYNGVDLTRYTPQGIHHRPHDHLRLLLVEGSLMGGYESGLEVAVDLADRLAQSSSPQYPGKVELLVAGRVSAEVRKQWDDRLAEDTPDDRTIVTWAGLVSAEDIPKLDRSAHLLYSADVNAACPNSVVEALACGLPVLGFDTGALSELVGGESGRLVPYGGNPWRLDPPDIASLEEAARQILGDQDNYRKAARSRAEVLFGLDRMVEGYLQALLA